MALVACDAADPEAVDSMAPGQGGGAAGADVSNAGGAAAGGVMGSAGNGAAATGGMSGAPGQGPTGAGDAWWNPDWTRRRELLISASTGAPVDGFVVLVTLKPDDVQDVLPAGADLRFIDADGTLLHHDIDVWAPNGTSLVWVRLARLQQDGQPQRFWMYYRNAAQTPDRAWMRQTWVDGAWIYHLSGDGTEAGSLAADATPIDTEATSHPFAEGKIGEAWQGNAALSRRLALPTGIPLLQGRSGVSVSAWVNSEAASQRIVSFGPDAAVLNDKNSNHDMLRFGFFKGQIGLYARTAGRSPIIGTEGTSAFDVFTASKPVVQNEWQHLAAVADLETKTLRFYRNGEEVEAAVSFELSVPAFHEDLVSGQGAIGARGGGNYEHFRGMIDELRVEPELRPAAWWKAHYGNVTGQLSVTVKAPTAR